MSVQTSHTSHGATVDIAVDLTEADVTEDLLVSTSIPLNDDEWSTLYVQLQTDIAAKLNNKNWSQLYTLENMDEIELCDLKQFIIEFDDCEDINDQQGTRKVKLVLKVSKLPNRTRTVVHITESESSDA